ncbi:DUF1805 domain-containing protein [Candidatus Micrarchaeota archaeon]|jgi:uncharacterized protein YunC (DUF1805 family)|nr:DUF1805 domain-containing protein [Candidatus Micrarchaeota archaeon]
MGNSSIMNMTEETVKFGDKDYKAVRLILGTVPLLIIKAENGYVASTYIDHGAAEKLGDIACFVTNVKSFEDFEKAKVKHATSWAEDLGIRPGMSIKKALEIMGGD